MHPTTNTPHSHAHALYSTKCADQKLKSSRGKLVLVLLEFGVKDVLKFGELVDVQERQGRPWLQCIELLLLKSRTYMPKSSSFS